MAHGPGPGGSITPEPTYSPVVGMDPGATMIHHHMPPPAFPGAHPSGQLDGLWWLVGLVAFGIVVLIILASLALE